MSSTDANAGGAFTPYRDTLLATARASIREGLLQGRALRPDLDAALPAPLLAQGASFVTLDLDGDLRGCIGSLEAHRSLIEDVAANAYGAAFRDPRFLPVTDTEFERLKLYISILQPAQPLAFDSEGDLLRQLRPGVDGLILEAGAQRGTFLPVVWEALPEPQQFLQQLKRKAGLAMDYWSAELRVWRYTTESIGDAD